MAFCSPCANSSSLSRLLNKVQVLVLELKDFKYCKFTGRAKEISCKLLAIKTLEIRFCKGMLTYESMEEKNQKLGIEDEMN